jgi:hypothetical protein
MATLWWNWSHYALSEALGNIGELKGVIANELPRLGYTGVQNAEDVHGAKGQFLLAVVYLPISGRTFWQVVACGGSGTVEGAQAEVTEVTKMIGGLKFL